MTYRYPINISNPNASYLIFTRAKHKGFTTKELRNVSDAHFTTTTQSGFGLPVPDAITDTSSIAYTDLQDSSIESQLIQSVADRTIGNKVQQNVQMNISQKKAIQSLLQLEGVGLKSFAFSWVLIPESKEEMQNIESIIKEFELGKLPEYTTNLMTFPDVFKIRFGGIKPKLIRFLPCVITDISTQFGAEHFQVYEDGGFPSISLTVTFSEIASRTREIQEKLYEV